MAGGFGTGKPFSWNPKCVVYAGGLAGLYWILPPKNGVVFVGYLVGGYWALSVYDTMFNCDAEIPQDVLNAWNMPMFKKKPCCKGCGEKKGCASQNLMGASILG